MRFGTKQLARMVLTAASVLIVLYIFSNSAIPAAGSDVQSSRMLTFLQGVLDGLGIPVTLTVRFVRKLAHFVEYSVFGGVLMGCVSAYTARLEWRMLISGIVFAAVPVADELIQLVTPGRSCQISDMLLDFGGAVFGGAAVLLVMTAVGRRNPNAFSGGQEHSLIP